MTGFRSAGVVVLSVAALVSAFCLGGAFQAATSAVPYHRAGAVAALYDVRADATKRYLDCISDHCERERATYEDVVAITDVRLGELEARAASVDTHAERGDAKQAPSARMGSAVPEGQTPKVSHD